ncbi:MAG: carboxypeptidase regulatory-like domain-containing protein [Deltaproteobacteria bacterium]|nr:carboxypeptidase regulatory-like domain-containing protein [Deltaproteobacteria bacterium]MBN2673558.1 carboxypeptidase regulatory-like domain-containing protein [Deltaproteobacteria bacterium]
MNKNDSGRFGFPLFGFVLAILLSTRPAVADDTTVPTFSIAQDGLPGFFHLPVPYTPGKKIALSGTGRYGIMETVGPEEGRHHELGGRIAVGAVILPWFAAALNFDGKYMNHPRDSEGDDYSVIGNPSLAFRMGGRIQKAALLGGELGVWFPGSNAPSIQWDATTLTAKLLATLIPWTPFHIGAQIGFRLDNSANGAPEVSTLRPGDRIALDASDFHSLISGIAASYSISALTLILEINSQFFLGKGPTFKNSPMIVTFGARYQATPGLSFDVYTDTALNQRPGVLPDDPLVPTPSRFTVLAGIRYAWNFGQKAISAPPLESIPEPEKKETVPEERAAEGAPMVGTVSGQILDEEQLPIADAEVKVVVDDTEKIGRTDGDGNYSVSDVPVGTAEITISAEYFEPRTFTVNVANGETTATPATSLVETKVGSQVRGLVRDVDGTPLDASILVLPDKAKTKTDSEGFFELDVEPGDYTIQISATGYIRQKHEVTVGDNSVVILNVDMSKKR